MSRKKRRLSTIDRLRIAEETAENEKTLESALNALHGVVQGVFLVTSQLFRFRGQHLILIFKL